MVCHVTGYTTCLTSLGPECLKLHPNTLSCAHFRCSLSHLSSMGAIPLLDGLAIQDVWPKFNCELSEFSCEVNGNSVYIY